MTNKKAISVLFLPLSLVVIVVGGEAFDRTNSVIDLKMECLKFLSHSKTIYTSESEILQDMNIILSKQSQHRRIDVILFDQQAS
jgi:hypothetical protein